MFVFLVLSAHCTHTHTHTLILSPYSPHHILSLSWTWTLNPEVDIDGAIIALETEDGGDLILSGAENTYVSAGLKIDIKGDSGVDIETVNGDIDINAPSGSIHHFADKLSIGTRSGVNIETDDGEIVIETEGDGSGSITLQAGIDSNDSANVFIRAVNDIDLTAGEASNGSATSNGGDINLEALAGAVNTASGGNVAVNTDGNGDFTVDNTVVPGP